MRKNIRRRLYHRVFKGENKNLHKLLGQANQLRHEAELREAIANTKVEAPGK